MRLLRGFAVLGAAFALLIPIGSATAASATYVHPGQSIQAAINAAAAGSWIVVERGTYRENLVITKSIRLTGRHAVLEPPATPGPNPCGFSRGGPPPVVGLCIMGQVDQNFQVTRTVDNVSVEGFTIRNFSGDGAFAFGAKNLRAVRNTFAKNGGYGIFVSTTATSWLLFNSAYGNHAPGLYFGDSPNANATVVGNRSFDNLGEGILFRDSLGGRIALNDLHGNCAGLFVLDTGATGAGGNVSVSLNQVTSNNRLCPGEVGEAPAFGGIGIALLGAQNTTVVANLVRNNDAQPSSRFPGGGIVLLDTGAFGGTVPTGNSVRHNVLSGNDAEDINGDGTGTGNTISGNICTTSNVVGAC